MGHVLPRALRRRFSLLFYNSRLAKPGQKSTQYASIATTYSILPLVMLQKSIHHVAIQILERDMFALKPSSEIGDHLDLVSDRVSRIALLGYSGSVSVKVHAQRPLAEPFNRFWESEKLVYHSPRMPTTMPKLCLVNFCQSLAGSGIHAVRRHSPGCCIVQRILSRVPSSEMPQICTPST